MTKSTTSNSQSLQVNCLDNSLLCTESAVYCLLLAVTPTQLHCSELSLLMGEKVEKVEKTCPNFMKPPGCN